MVQGLGFRALQAGPGGEDRDFSAPVRGNHRVKGIRAPSDKFGKEWITIAGLGEITV